MVSADTELRSMTPPPTTALKEGDPCVVLSGTHKGKRGIARDLHISKGGHLTITVVQANGERFKTLGRNVEVQKKTAPAKRAAKSTTAPVKLLSGGNPQIAKGDGDAPVQAYIAAMPGWKRAIGEELDALIEQHVPKLQKAVKWNSPFYGVEDQGWFLATHVFTHFVRITWFQGQALKPIPPGPNKDPNARYLDIRESGIEDEKQLVSWITQAAALPGWMKH
jgi:hypothetical protein